MGNKLGRRRQVVDEKYTRPQGLYQHRDVDHKKLRKLILESKLAPCFPGDEECTCDLEECPICFLYYPSLNRSRCCMKSICTECFLQMKTPNSTRPTQCPFCKTSNYAVEYRGVKTKEEKGIEQIEEQRVIEAKIRMRQQELQDDEERMQKRLEISSSGRMVVPGEVEYSSTSVPASRFPVEGEEIVASQDSRAPLTIRPPLQTRQNRYFLSINDVESLASNLGCRVGSPFYELEESGKRRNPAYGDAAPSAQYVTGDRFVSPEMALPAESSSSPSGGLACAIAALAERQQIGGESSLNYNGNMSAFNMLPGRSRVSSGAVQDVENYTPTESSNEVSPDSRMAVTGDDGEWGVDHGSEVAEAGTSYTSSDTIEEAGVAALPPPDEIEGSFQNVTGRPIIPESFEEQMMLAMAVSLAEARAMTSAQGVAWQ
ncbi:hypothetical protein L1049_000438 [Liquidambar formosana]|uniref:RING-type domain-containing protein n=1 Tax=Liquidambar formosana TaxID=63359 RepID=A0AAP0R5D0_LIQFO